MTVIVYRDGVLAADSGGFIGDICVSRIEKKIHRTPAGELLGCCGTTDESVAFAKWADDGYIGAPPAASDGFGAVVATTDGKIIRHGRSDGRAWVQDQTEMGWAAVGAHPEFVLALIFLGLPAEEIVAHACEHCVWAAGPVMVERLVRETEPPAEAITLADLDPIEQPPTWRENMGL